MENIGKIIEILQAFKEGKTIEYFVKFKDESYEWRTLTNTKDVLDCIYKEFKVRIKKEQTYRPYANAEEFIKASKEHGPHIKVQNSFLLPNLIMDSYVKICSVNSESKETYQSLLNINYAWQDGTPCGILEDYETESTFDREDEIS